MEVRTRGLGHHTLGETRTKARFCQAATRHLFALPAPMDMSNSTRRALPLPSSPPRGGLPTPVPTRSRSHPASGRVPTSKSQGAPQIVRPLVVRPLKPSEAPDESAIDADLPSLAVPNQAQRAEFVPAHPIPGGSGMSERRQRSTPPPPVPAEPPILEHDPILFVSHSQGPLDALFEPLPPEPSVERPLDADDEPEPDAAKSVAAEETVPCMRVRLAPRKRMRRALCMLTLGLSLALVVLGARSWHWLQSGTTWGASLSAAHENLRSYFGR